MKKKILIYDDDPETANRWEKELGGLKPVRDVFYVKSITRNDFEKAVSQLENRQRGARSSLAPEPAWGNNLFDKAAILILDYDLLDVDKKTYLTGETVAYLARCYSSCGLIIAYNQYGKYGDNSFDLTLRGHPESYADLQLDSPQFSNRGLWLEPWKGFRPWSWPLLPLAAKAFESRVKQLKNHLDDGIMSFLGFPDELAGILPRSIGEFIQGQSLPERTTFREFVMKSRNGLRPKDQLPKDEPLNEEMTARIAAAQVAKWLECLVLPGQDILVDAPHLVSRYPSLLKGDCEKVETWNKTASFVEVPRLGLHYRIIDAYRFKKQDWLSRAAWFWNGVSNCQKIEEVADPWSTKRKIPDLVFCEDISRFLRREAAREFVADLPSPFVRRFVVDPESPKTPKFARELKKISYRPSVHFSL